MKFSLSEGLALIKRVLADGNLDQNIETSGNLRAGGGYRHTVGPFNAQLAASQTGAATNFGSVSGAAFVAKRAGLITGLSAQLSAAITGAGTTATVHVTVNGTIAATLNIQFTQAGAEVVQRVTLARASGIAIVAGDLVRVTYTSTGISNTPTVVATVEIEQ